MYNVSSVAEVIYVLPKYSSAAGYIFWLQVHFLYQFSLQFFLDIFTAVLMENPHLKDIRDYNQRLSVITSDLFKVSLSCESLDD